MIYMLISFIVIETGLLFLLVEKYSKSMQRDTDISYLVEKYHKWFLEDDNISIRAFNLFDEFTDELNEIYNDEDKY